MFHFSCSNNIIFNSLNVFRLLSYLTPRSIIEFDKLSIESEKDDLDNKKQGNVEILPPGPVEQIGRIAAATSPVRGVPFTMVGNLRHFYHFSLVSLFGDWRLDVWSDSQCRTAVLDNKI